MNTFKYKKANFKNNYNNHIIIIIIIINFIIMYMHIKYMR